MLGPGKGDDDDGAIEDGGGEGREAEAFQGI